jgi:general secretion pathway protein C
MMGRSAATLIRGGVLGGTTGRKRFFHRLAVMAAAALIVGTVLTLEGPEWYERLAQLWQPTAPVARQLEPNRTRSHGPPLLVTPTRPTGNDSSVSPVPLPLILAGTFPGRNSREGTAEIGVDAQSPQTYAAGALLSNNARLTEIYADRVVLEKNGKSVRLYLQGQNQPDQGRFADLLTVGGRPPEPHVTGTSRVQLTDYVRPTPVFRGADLHGYALYAGRYSTTFTDLGLEPGDVVTEIDGRAITDAAPSLAALQALVTGAALNVVIERSGQARRVALDGTHIVKAIGESHARHSSLTADTSEGSLR